MNPWIISTTQPLNNPRGLFMEFYGSEFNFLVGHRERGLTRPNRDSPERGISPVVTRGCGSILWSYSGTYILGFSNVFNGFDWSPGLRLGIATDALHCDICCSGSSSRVILLWSQQMTPIEAPKNVITLPYRAMWADAQSAFLPLFPVPRFPALP